jgi:hypothetical protein
VNQERCDFRQQSPLSRILNAEERPAITRKIEWAILVAACLLALGLNIVLDGHSGAFWRDEASTLHVATAPCMTAMWERLRTDSAPVLIHSVLRVWIATGLGASEHGLRLLGTLVSLGIIVSLFVSCRILTGRVPLLAMALVVFNVAVFYYGSSLRAYGLAALVVMLCLAAFWRVVQRPTGWNILASLILATLCCHANYQNSFLLLAIGLAGAGTCAISRLWRRSLLILAICFVAAVSMLVYVPIIFARQDTDDFRALDSSLPIIGKTLGDAVSGGSTALLCVWIVLALGSLVGLIAQAVRPRESAPGGRTPSLAVYCLIAMVIAEMGGIAFIRAYSLFPFSWHYVPLMAFTAIAVEVAFQSPRNKAWVWCVRVSAACTVIALSLPGLWEAAHLRRTSVDCVSTVVARQASPNDLILVNPSGLAPGFDYYYRGAAEWNTLPLIPNDKEAKAAPDAAVREVMAIPNGIAPTLKKIEDTLASGHRLWIVGGVEFLPPKTLPPDLPPAPHSRYGWHGAAYAQAWSKQVGYYIQTHAQTARVVPVDVPQPVSPLANVPLMCVEGWNGNADLRDHP